MVDPAHLPAIPETDLQAMAPATRSAVIDLSAGGVIEVPHVGGTLYVGTAGDIKMALMRDAAPVLYKSVPAGWQPCRVKSIDASGTTAKDLIVVW